MELRELIPAMAGLMSVTGYEAYDHAALAPLVAGFDEDDTDAVGNRVLVRRCGRENAPRILIDTHFDEIGLYVTDNKGNTFISTKDSGEAELEGDVIWGKADLVDGGFTVGGGNKGSNGTHEFYVFKINTGNASGQTPSGQPLPGIVATLLVGGGALAYLKKRKKLYKAE